MKKYFFASLLCGLAACAGSVEKNEPNVNSSDTVTVIDKSFYTNETEIKQHVDSNLLTCTQAGVLKFNSSYTEIEKQFGKNNLRNDRLYAEGEETAFTTVVYPNSSREVVVIWKEAKQPFKSIVGVNIGYPNSVYHFANGLKVGTTLKELVQLNGDIPVSFYGFGWDYGGTMPTPQPGKLKDSIPCFSGILGSKKQLDNKYMGDMEFNSGMKGMPINDIFLQEIRITLSK